MHPLPQPPAPRIPEENVCSKRWCVANGDYIVITKNSGEPFSLNSSNINDPYGNGSNAEVKISGYSKGSSTKKTSSVYLNGVVPANLNWDGPLKVDIRAPAATCTCIDDVVVET